MLHMLDRLEHLIERSSYEEVLVAGAAVALVSHKLVLGSAKLGLWLGRKVDDRLLQKGSSAFKRIGIKALKCTAIALGALGSLVAAISASAGALYGTVALYRVAKGSTHVDVDIILLMALGSAVLFAFHVIKVGLIICKNQDKEVRHV